MNENSPTTLANRKNGNNYLSNLVTSANNSKRESSGEGEGPPGMLDDYFQKMQQQTKSHLNNPRMVNVNRSNSQAVRGNKARGDQTAYNAASNSTEHSSAQ